MTDLPLLPDGVEEARELGRRLAGRRFDRIYTSDRRRARETAVLAGIADPTETPLLSEYDYGEYEGLTSDQIRGTRPGWRIFKDGCPGGEAPDEVYHRAAEFIRQAEAAGRVLAFSHGHFIRALAAAWTEAGVGLAERLDLDTAAVCILRNGSRPRLIRIWNSTSGELPWPPPVVLA